MTDAISLCQSSLKGQPAAADRNERKENGENRGREIERGIMREREREGEIERLRFTERRGYINS